MTNPKPQGQHVEVQWPKDGAVHAKAIGIPDILTAVDSRSPAVLAAEEFAACEIRCHMLHGQWLAELDHLKELSLALDQERDAAVKRVQEAGR